MHQMSSSIAGMLEEGRVPNTEAALAKDLGTRFEQDIPEAARSLFGEELRASFDDDDMFNETLRYSTLYAPAYSIRGGTKEILRGIIAKSLGLRSEAHTSELQSIMRNSYAVFCLKKNRQTKTEQKKSTEKSI